MYPHPRLTGLARVCATGALLALVACTTPAHDAAQHVSPMRGM